jgi:hypothetical protein
MSSRKGLGRTGRRMCLNSGATAGSQVTSRLPGRLCGNKHVLYDIGFLFRPRTQ